MSRSQWEGRLAVRLDPLFGPVDHLVLSQCPCLITLFTPFLSCSFYFCPNSLFERQRVGAMWSAFGLFGLFLLLCLRWSCPFYTKVIFTSNIISNSSFNENLLSCILIYKRIYLHIITKNLVLFLIEGKGKYVLS